MSQKRIEELEDMLRRLTSGWSGFECKTVDNKGIFFFYVHGKLMDEALKVLNESDGTS